MGRVEMGKGKHRKLLIVNYDAQVNVSTDPSRTVDISEGDNTIVDYTYSVKWRETTIPFEKRMDKYSRYSFLPQHLEARIPSLVHCE